MSLITDKPIESSVTAPKGEWSALPVPAWRQVSPYLSKADQERCGLTCRRLGILFIKGDPSLELEAMRRRRIPIPKSISRKIQGPSERFLYSSSSNPREQARIQAVLKEMQSDTNVAKTVKGIFEQEALHSEAFPIYHGTNISTFLYTLINREFLSVTHGRHDSLSKHIPMIRFPSSEEPRTVKDHFKKFPCEEGDDAYDWDPDISASLISCNPYLFSNLQNPSESTWHFYLKGSSISPPNKEKFFLMLCEKYNLQYSKSDKDKFIKLYDQLNSLRTEYHKHFNTPTRGMILQIFVSPERIDAIAYASLPYGVPLSNKQTLSERHSKICADPRSNTEMQVRIVTQSLFEEDGVKVVTHGCPLLTHDQPQQKDTFTKSCFATKNKILGEMRDLFTKMILLSPKPIV